MPKIFLLLLVSLSLFACSDSKSGPVGTDIGSTAPSIKTTLVSGEEFQLSSLKGQYIILEFYASWCGPCHRELPKLKKLYAEQQAKGASIEVVSIALEKDEATGEKFLEQTSFPWKHQILNESRFVRFDPIASAYGVTDIPSSFLLDPDGNILAAHSSIDEIRAILETR